MDGLFGSQARTDVLVAVARLGESYPSELAALLGRQLTEVRRAIASLEEAGVVVTRTRGRTRLTTLNQRHPQAAPLYALLLDMSATPRYEGRFNVRRRPRATGKIL